MTFPMLQLFLQFLDVLEHFFLVRNISVFLEPHFATKKETQVQALFTKLGMPERYTEFNDPTVRLARHARTGRLLALKVINVVAEQERRRQRGRGGAQELGAGKVEQAARRHDGCALHATSLPLEVSASVFATSGGVDYLFAHA